MAIASPADLRKRTVLVTVPNTSPPIQIRCQRPLLPELVTNNWIPLEAYHLVIEGMARWQDLPDAAQKLAHINKEQAEHPELYDAFIDRWVVAAALEPKMVMTEDEAAADPKVLWIGDLDMDIKLLVFANTAAGMMTKKARGLLEEFCRQRAISPDARPDSDAVRGESVGTATH